MSSVQRKSSSSSSSSSSASGSSAKKRKAEEDSGRNLFNDYCGHMRTIFTTIVDISFIKMIISLIMDFV